MIHYQLTDRFAVNAKIIVQVFQKLLQTDIKKKLGLHPIYKFYKICII